MLDPLTTPDGAQRLQLLIAVLMAVFLVAWAVSPPSRRRRWTDFNAPSGQAVLSGLVVVALLGGISYFYGARAGGSWLHRWDLYHTSISAKYFDELGYTGLYECTVVLDQLGPRTLPGSIDRIRDLETLEHGPVAAVTAGSDCVDRFSPERRASFEEDIATFSALDARWEGMLGDKGYNGTPFYTTLAKGAFSLVPIEPGALTGLALIDVVLILAALGAVAWAFGPLAGLVAAILLFVNFPARFTHMGGSFLRFDYLAAILAALAAMRRGRHGVAGGLMGYATLVRVFPGLFVLGYLGKAAYDWARSGELQREHLRFAAGLGAVAAIGLGVSVVVLGPGAWSTWLSDLVAHSENTAGFRVGFKHLFMFEGNLYGEDGFVGFAQKTENFLPRQEWYAAGIGLMVLPLLARWRRLDSVTATALFGTLTFYLLLTSTRYYYAVLVVLVLLGWGVLQNRGYTLLVAGLFGVSALGYLAGRTNDFAPWLYNTVMSYGLAVWFVAMLTWLLVAAPALSREEPQPRGSPSPP